MRLFFVRHGESVDNVAGLYAGSRDSALTVHGVLQARRLGAHFAALPVAITHVFSSDLQRASATASAILDAQPKTDEKAALEGGGGGAAARGVIQLADLRERDFRSGEGAKFGGGGGSTYDFADAESWDEMRVRADRFIEGHLCPLLTRAAADDRRAVVVVAHGLILNALLSALLQRYAPSELARLLLPPPPVAVGDGGGLHRDSALRLPWRNTGYLGIAVKAAVARRSSDENEEQEEEEAGDGSDNKQGKAAVVGTAAIRLQVTVVNCVEHLSGLKRTRGGIGSAQFDAKQKTIDAFFEPVGKKQG